MVMTTSDKKKSVEVLVLRAFRYFKPDGNKVIYKPGTTAELPFQFAREMESAGKVSFDLKAEVEIQPEKKEAKK